MSALPNPIANGYCKTVGLDIGYSNLKVAYGSGPSPETFCLPSGSGPAKDLVQSLSDSKTNGSRRDGVSVWLTNRYGLEEEWVAGVDWSHFGGSRIAKLDPDYARSMQYKALFLAALASLNATQVDLLVTGLPVEHFYDTKLVSDIQAMFTGRQKLRPNRFVNVSKVECMPQPAGGYVSFLSSAKDQATQDRFASSRVLVLDPGYFSFDWALFDQHGLVRQSSSNSTRAMSTVCERVSRYIRDDLCAGNISRERLERAIRQGDEKILVGSRELTLKEILQDVLPGMTELALQDVTSSLRGQQGDDINYVFLVGGGGRFYYDAVRKVFPSYIEVILDYDPVTANARGYWGYGDR